MGKIIPIGLVCVVIFLGAFILYQKTFESALKAKWGSKNDTAVTAIIRAQEEANKKKERVDEAIRQLVDGPDNHTLDTNACRVLEEAGLLKAAECPARPRSQAGQSPVKTDSQ